MKVKVNNFFSKIDGIGRGGTWVYKKMWLLVN